MMWKALLTLPFWLFLCVGVLSLVFGWLYTRMIDPDLAELLNHHAEEIALSDETSAIPSSDEIDLYNGQWIEAARLKSRINYIHHFAGLFLSFTIYFVLFFGGHSAKLRDFGQETFSRPFLQKWAYLAIFSFLHTVIMLPWSYLSGFFRPHLFRLSTQTHGLWISDTIKGFILSLLIFVPIVWLLFLIIRKSPRFWWGWFTIASVPIILFLIYIGPKVIAPLFNTFEPIEDPLIKEKVLSLAEKADIPVKAIYSTDMSLRTVEGNAYMTGIGGSKEIVLGDTMLAHYTPGEIGFVLGHEMGHYRLWHLWFLIVMILVFILASLLLIFLLGPKILSPFAPQTGVRELQDIATYPLLALLFLVFGFFFDPMSNTYSRYLERQADVYALEITEDPVSGIGTFKKLAYQNLSIPNPSPFVEFWFYNHPSIEHRVQFLEGSLDEYPGK